MTTTINNSGLRLSLLFSAIAILSINARGQNVAFSITETNDYFTGTDQYFTNGIHLELQFRKTNDFLLTPILPVFPGFKTLYYGLGITQNMYTPSNKNSLEFLPGDLPYAGMLFASVYRVSVNKRNTLRLITEFNGGLLGRQAYSGEVQAGFHRLIKDKVPSGWENQLASDLILNYRFEVIKKLIQTQHLEVFANGNLNTGTILNDIGTGLTLKLGALNPTMQDLLYHNKKITAHLFGGGAYTYVIGNRLLGRSEANHVNISHHVYSYHYGAEVSSRSVKISYTVQTLSRQREDIGGHRYGSITVAFTII